MIEIRCNVLLDGLDVGEYTSDFVCTKADGDLMVRECVFRKFLMKPLTMKLSRYEQEVVINLNADEDEATVYTAKDIKRGTA